MTDIPVMWKWKSWRATVFKNHFADGAATTPTSKASVPSSVKKLFCLSALIDQDLVVQVQRNRRRVKLCPEKSFDKNFYQPCLSKTSCSGDDDYSSGTATVAIAALSFNSVPENFCFMSILSPTDSAVTIGRWRYSSAVKSMRGQGRWSTVTSIQLLMET